jgi:hypothetical protein
VRGKSGVQNAACIYACLASAWWMLLMFSILGLPIIGGNAVA